MILYSSPSILPHKVLCPIPTVNLKICSHKVLCPIPLFRQALVAPTPLLLQLPQLLRPSPGVGLQSVEPGQTGVSPGEGLSEPERLVTAVLRAKERVGAGTEFLPQTGCG